MFLARILRNSRGVEFYSSKFAACAPLFGGSSISFWMASSTSSEVFGYPFRTGSCSFASLAHHHHNIRWCWRLQVDACSSEQLSSSWCLKSSATIPLRLLDGLDTRGRRSPPRSGTGRSGVRSRELAWFGSRQFSEPVHGRLLHGMRPWLRRRFILWLAKDGIRARMCLNSTCTFSGVIAARIDPRGPPSSEPVGAILPAAANRWRARHRRLRTVSCALGSAREADNPIADVFYPLTLTIDQVDDRTNLPAEVDDPEQCRRAFRYRRTTT